MSETGKNQQHEGWAQLNTRIPVSVNNRLNSYLRTTSDSKQLTVRKALDMLLSSVGFGKEADNNGDTN